MKKVVTSCKAADATRMHHDCWLADTALRYDEGRPGHPSLTDVIHTGPRYLTSLGHSPVKNFRPISVVACGFSKRENAHAHGWYPKLQDVQSRMHDANS